jgi:hypothetical protein
VNVTKTEAQTNIDFSIISKWNITKAFPYTEHKLNFNNFSKEEYNKVTTEKSGLLPFSKYIEKPSAGNFGQNKEVYAVASTVIESNKNQVKSFSFDYSDKIMVYLNGKEIFKGNNAFRYKCEHIICKPKKRQKHTSLCCYRQSIWMGLIGKIRIIHFITNNYCSFCVYLKNKKVFY